MFGSNTKCVNLYTNEYVAVILKSLNITYTYDILADHFNYTENWRGDIGKTNKNAHKKCSCDTYNSYIASKFMIIGFFVSFIFFFLSLSFTRLQIMNKQERKNSHMQFE